MATKRGKEVTLHEGLQLIHSHNLLNMWSRDATWQIINISPLLQCPWPLNLIRWWHTVTSSHPQGSLVRSCDKLNALYLHLQKTHGHQTRPSAALPWVVPTLKAAWHFDYVTNVWLRDSLKNLNLHFHTTYGH